MRLAITSRSMRGDTIIEVIFAIVIFSFVAISSLMIMNKGIATGERALEITLVRQQINAQAEALRYIHEARVVASTGGPADEWSKFIASPNDGGYAQDGASPYGELGDDGECKIPADSYNPFILNARTAEIWDGLLTEEYDSAGSSPPYSQVNYNENTPTLIDAAYGIWIESVPSVPLDEGVDKRFVDFHIRACWPAPGSAIPMTLGTIVRLYDPV